MCGRGRERFDDWRDGVEIDFIVDHVATGAVDIG